MSVFNPSWPRQAGTFSPVIGIMMRVGGTLITPYGVPVQELNSLPLRPVPKFFNIRCDGVGRRRSTKAEK